MTDHVKRMFVTIGGRKVQTIVVGLCTRIMAKSGMTASHLMLESAGLPGVMNVSVTRKILEAAKV